MSLIELPEFEEEKRVVLAAQQGDRLSAGQLYQWFGDRLYRQVILPRLPVVEQAEDVLRDSFRIIFERISQFTPKDRSKHFSTADGNIGRHLWCFTLNLVTGNGLTHISRVILGNAFCRFPI